MCAMELQIQGLLVKCVRSDPVYEDCKLVARSEYVLDDSIYDGWIV